MNRCQELSRDMGAATSTQFQKISFAVRSQVLLIARNCSKGSALTKRDKRSFVSMSVEEQIWDTRAYFSVANWSGNGFCGNLGHYQTHIYKAGLRSIKLAWRQRPFTISVWIFLYCISVAKSMNRGQIGYLFIQVLVKLLFTSEISEFDGRYIDCLYQLG